MIYAAKKFFRKNRHGLSEIGSGPTQDKYHYDCLHFCGYKPCIAKRECRGCTQYAPWDKKILIIKLGALGDVMRTTPVLKAFHRENPRVHITWISKLNAKPILDANPRVHRALYIDQLDPGSQLRLLVETFDEVHCYDKDDSALSLSSLVKAKKKFGYYLNEFGQMAPLNSMAEYSFDLGLSDELKFKLNKKTYQEITYESSGLKIPAQMDPYDLVLTPKDKDAARKLFERLRWPIDRTDSKKSPIIGLNTGSGKVFKTKQWIEEYFIELARDLSTKFEARILLLGGKDEDEKNKRLAVALSDVAHYPGCDFSIREFASILEMCTAVVTSDTLAMHLALAVGTPPVVLFGSTCDQEIEMYGIGEKLVSRPECAPCYLNECNQSDSMKCMKAITPAECVWKLCIRKEFHWVVFHRC